MIQAATAAPGTPALSPRKPGKTSKQTAIYGQPCPTKTYPGGGVVVDWGAFEPGMCCSKTLDNGNCQRQCMGPDGVGSVGNMDGPCAQEGVTNVFESPTPE